MQLKPNRIYRDRWNNKVKALDEYHHHYGDKYLRVEVIAKPHKGVGRSQEWYEQANGRPATGSAGAVTGRYYENKTQ
jgi:hypothetical protein